MRLKLWNLVLCASAVGESVPLCISVDQETGVLVYGGGGMTLYVVDTHTAAHAHEHAHALALAPSEQPNNRIAAGTDAALTVSGSSASIAAVTPVCERVLFGHTCRVVQVRRCAHKRSCWLCVGCCVGVMWGCA